MASPNYSELLATTLSYYSDQIVDNASKKVPFLAFLRKEKNIKRIPGGNNIVQPLEYAENSTYTRYSGWEEFDITPSDVITAAVYDWKQIGISVSISGLEQLKNSGSKQQLFDLLRAKVKNAENTFDNNFGTDLHGDGTSDGGKQIGGLGAAVPTDPTTGIYGNIDRSSWAFWRTVKRSCLTDGGAAASAANIVSNLDAMYLSIQQYSKSKPGLVLADSVFFGYFEQAVHPLQRINNAAAADLGFDGYSYKGIPVVYDPDCAASTAYMLTPSKLFLCVHSDRDMVPLDGDRTSLNQDGIVKLMGWAGNMTMSHARCQGRLTA